MIIRGARDLPSLATLIQRFPKGLYPGTVMIRHFRENESQDVVNEVNRIEHRPSG